jgi:hypothetical protein
MAIPSVAESLKYVNLQMAAEAFLKDEQTGAERYTGQLLIDALEEGNDHASFFAKEAAEDFADPVKGWTVLDQEINTGSGFSGTLFKNNQTNELVISFRSTEFIDDVVRDNMTTNTMEIFETGWAWGQMADMEEWYTSVKSQITGPVSVTGYSLGAHLATAFNILRAQDKAKGISGPEITQVVTFNGAGVGTVDAGYQNLDEVLDQFMRLRDDSSLVAAEFTDPALRTIYLTLAGRTYNTKEEVDLAQAQLYAALGGGQAAPPGTNLIVAAFDEIRAIIAETKRISAPGFNAGGEGDGAADPPKYVAPSEIDGANLNYRMAVHFASQETQGVTNIDWGVTVLPFPPGVTPTNSAQAKVVRRRPGHGSAV